MTQPLVPNFAWQTLRPVRKVGALHGIIEVPTFSAVCGPNNYSFDMFGSVWDGFPHAGTQLDAACTFEVWIKVLQLNDFRFLVSNTNGVTTSSGLALNTDGTVRFVLTEDTNTVHVLNSTLTVAAYEWCHIAGTWDGTTMKVYINGELDPTTTAFAAGSIIATTTLKIGDGAADNAHIYFNEVRIWNDCRTQQEIQQHMFAHRDTSTNIDANLVVYFPFNDGAGETLTNTIFGKGFDIIFSGPAPGAIPPWMLTDAYPYKLGTSFVAGVFPIDSNGKIYSIRKPLRKPYADVNFVPCIQWSVDGVLYRYQLWDGVVGFNDHNIIPMYNNQRIPDGAYLEIWNMDGNTTVDLTESFNLTTSILHTVIESDVSTQTEDSEPLTIDTTLAEPFPLTFPLTFNTQQSYSIG